MIEKALLMDMLKDFFDKQIHDGLQSRFMNALSDDFDKVFAEFNSYITKKNLMMDKTVNQINFHDAAKLIMDEICALKVQCIKYHHKMLIESADRAKELAMRHKDGVH